MSLNFGGVGFGFTAEAANFDKVYKGLISGFERVSASARGVADSTRPVASGFDMVADRVLRFLGLRTDVAAVSDMFARMPQSVDGFADAVRAESGGAVDAVRRVDQASRAFVRDAQGRFAKAVPDAVAETTRAYGALADEAVQSSERAAAATRMYARDSQGKFTKTIPDSAAMSSDALKGLTQQARDNFTYDLPVAAEAMSRSFHKESYRVVSDSEGMGRGMQQIAKSAEGLPSIFNRVMRATGGLGKGLKGLAGGAAGGLSGVLGALRNPQMELTTGLEAEAQSLAKSARAMGAQLGYSGKELSRFSGQATSMAMSLNVDANTAAKAIYAFNWASKEFASVGVKNAEQAAKMQESMGVDVGAMAQQLRRLREQYQFTDAGTQAFVAGLYALGKESGSVPQMLQKIPAVMEAVGMATDATGKQLRGVELEKFAQETVVAASGLYAIYQDADKATEVAIGMAKSIGEGREQFSQLFTGANTEFPGLIQNLQIMGIDSRDAFNLMGQGPEGFMRGLAQLGLEMRKQGKDSGPVFAQIRGWLSKALGPEAAAVMEDFTSRMGASDEATLNLMATVKTAKVDLGKLADEAHVTGRTLQETFDRAQESMRVAFRSITRKEAVAFVGGASKEFAAFGKQLAETAKQGGLVGGLIKRLSLVDQLGVFALLPRELQGVAALVGPIAGQFGKLFVVMAPMAPLLASLGAPALALGAALGVLAPVVAVLGLKAFKLVLEGKKLGDIFNTLTADFQSFMRKGLVGLDKFVTDVRQRFDKLDLLGFFRGIFKRLSDIGKGKTLNLSALIFGESEGGTDAVGTRIDRILSGITGMIKSVWIAFSTAFSEVKWGEVLGGVWDSLVSYLSSIPWKEYLAPVGEAMKTIFIDWPYEVVSWLKSVDIVTPILVFIQDIPKAISNAGASIGSDIAESSTWFWDMLSKAFDVTMFSVGILTGIGPAIAAIDIFASLNWSQMADDLWTGTKGVFAKVGPMIVDGLSQMWQGVVGYDWKGLLSSIIGGLWDVIIDVTAGIFDWGGVLFEGIGQSLVSAADGLSAWVESADLMGTVERFVADIPAMLERFFEPDSAEGLGQRMWDSLVSGLTRGLAGFGKIILQLFVSILPAVIELTLRVVQAVVEVSWGLLKGLADILWQGVKLVGGWLRDIGVMLYASFKDWVAEAMSSLVRPFSGMIATIKQFFVQGLQDIRGFWSTTWGSLASKVSEWYDSVVGYVNTFKSKITEFFQDPASILGPGFEELSERLGAPWEKVQEVMSAFQTRAKDFFKPFLDSATNLYTKIVQKFKDIFGGIADLILRAYEKLPAKFQDLSKDLISGLKQIRGEAGITAQAIGAPVNVVLKAPQGAAAVYVARAAQLQGMLEELMQAREAYPKDVKVAQHLLNLAKQGFTELGDAFASESEKVLAVGKAEAAFKAVKAREQLLTPEAIYQMSRSFQNAMQLMGDATAPTAESIRNADAAIKELRGSVDKAVGHSIQWDWYDAMKVMRLSNDQTILSFGEMGMALGGVEGAVGGVFGSMQSFGSGLLGDVASGVDSQVQSAQQQVERTRKEAQQEIDRRKRELDQYVQPIQEVVAAANYPSWYDDWKATALQISARQEQMMAGLGQMVLNVAAKNVPVRPAKTTSELERRGYMSSVTPGSFNRPLRGG